MVPRPRSKPKRAAGGPRRKPQTLPRLAAAPAPAADFSADFALFSWPGEPDAPDRLSDEEAEECALDVLESSGLF